ncbi:MULTISPECIES: transketolase family protein [unclassified Variovorax]|uniref:transketolase family protein n=1 Tax=unclassified Variovorax TaxID=663243 RepID=UPI000D12BCDE|nr:MULTISPECIES: transketolase C-terminal domain-containing protein [unclassified Variovorax]AVQ82231.1 transketolase [Variovorax sp. PMC12]QRY33508.1 transketolase [Variovorax sp. PDNC026]
MRAAFSAALVEAATKDERVVLLTGDHGYALFDEFRKRCPGQYINAGIAEQNMVGVAAGLAKAGFRPIVYGLSAFVPVRVVEQIKIDVCYEKLPVIFTGDGAGLVYSTLGTSHQSFEDIACLRSVPYIDIMSPCDAHELTACMSTALTLQSPVYMRMGKADLGAVHAKAPSLTRGELACVQRGQSRVHFIATGSMVKTACELGAELDVSVWSAPWIKPLDAGQLRALAASSSAFVTLEEHSAAGGLGAAVLEAISETNPVPVLRIGVGERFSETCGSHAHAMREHGLDIASVRSRVAPFVGKWAAFGAC